MPAPTKLAQLNDLLNKAELHGVAIIRKMAEPEKFAASFDQFRGYIDEIDKFYVLVDLVEDQLPLFEAARRDKLAHNLVNLRWQVCIVEVNATRIFILQIGEKGRSMPFGSRDFLQRRRDRLGDIDLFYDRFGEQHGLPKLQAELVDTVRRLLDNVIGKSSSLPDLLADAMEQSRDEPVIQQPRLRSPGEITGSVTQKRRPAELKVKVVYGRYYADGMSLQAVAEACAESKMTMDQLAQQLGVNRTQLGLMLNGADAMSKRIYEDLRDFLRKG
ncbi:hypothetical protein FNB15_15900 [Ferrovibrio terrae]|uniref:Uncharacterized protein n=1 Tax=Ferrovibrio terrae TaxID=2594003 RepID=A0A516H4V2_9PROT|nr:hypothetical protein [Ferrovibrio terrae]QDO98670.1 hypothetical protein FNB15_15900 [Ferrovibrio terrae]